MGKPLLSIVTPTTGADGLFRLIESIERQDVDTEHILLWDDKREGRFSPGGNDEAPELIPADLESGNTTSIVTRGSFVQGRAAGSALRAVGLMACQGEYVTFADSDVWHEPNHLTHLLATIKGKRWAFCRRKIWSSDGSYIGVDNFESVGDTPDRRVPYVLVDNNTMIFERRLGSMAAPLYRETEDYNDDRLMTKMLYERAGAPGVSKQATVNQVCPQGLETMFRSHCTP